MRRLGILDGNHPRRGTNVRTRLRTTLLAFLVRDPGLRRLVQRTLNVVWALARPFPPLRAQLASLLALDAGYDRWIALYDTLDGDEWLAMETCARSLRWQPCFSILMPVCDTSEQFLVEAIESVLGQVYENWELCIADDASTAPHVREVLERTAAQDERIKVAYRSERGGISAASNEAAALATGEYLGFLDHDDVLRPHALLMMAHELDRHPEAELLYSDEDKLDGNGSRYDHYFKPDWNPALLRSQNYVCHFTVLRRERFEEHGGLRSAYDGSQDWDLLLRVSDDLPPERICHVPHVLYHWRSADGSAAQSSASKPTAVEAGRRVVEEALARAGVEGAVSSINGMYQRVRYALPEPRPRVDVVIPTTAKPELLEPCLDGLLGRTAYAPLAVTVAVSRNTLDLPDRARLLDKACADDRVRLFVYDDDLFNYSRVNNRAVEDLDASLLLLLNDDVRVIHADWLEIMVGHVLQEGVAAVGPMLYYPNDMVQHGGVIVGLGGGVAGHSHLGFLRGHPGYRGRAWADQDVSCVTAGCMLLRRDAFDAVGGLDERLAVAYNDVDLCLRIVDRGWRIVWTPAAELYHRESVSVGRPESSERREQFERERQLMVHRWGDRLLRDPHYNPNLSLHTPYKASFPPRIDYPWRLAQPARERAAAAS